jgi:ATP-dependent DNA helicase RecG
VASFDSKAPLSKSQIALASGKKRVSGQIHGLVNQLLRDGTIERAIVDNPQRRLQRYRLTDKGREQLRSN